MEGRGEFGLCVYVEGRGEFGLCVYVEGRGEFGLCIYVEGRGEFWSEAKAGCVVTTYPGCCVDSILNSSQCLINLIHNCSGRERQLDQFSRETGQLGKQELATQGTASWGKYMFPGQLATQGTASWGKYMFPGQLATCT